MMSIDILYMLPYLPDARYYLVANVPSGSLTLPYMAVDNTDVGIY